MSITLYQIPKFDSIRDFQNFNTRVSSAFVTRKIALASKALFDRGVSASQVAKELELASGEAVRALISQLNKGVYDEK